MMLWPLIILIYVLIYDLWTQVDILQYSMLTLYIILFLILQILFFQLKYHIYYSSFLYPGTLKLPFPTLAYTKSQYKSNKNEKIEAIISYITQYFYSRLILIPIRNQILYYYCGKDVASIIISYLVDLDQLIANQDNKKNDHDDYSGPHDDNDKDMIEQLGLVSMIEYINNFKKLEN